MKIIIFYYLAADIGMPVASWLGLLITAIMGLLFFLLKDSYNRLLKRTEILEKEVEDAKRLLEIEKLRASEEMRKIDKAINDLYLKILEQLKEMTKTINDARK